MPVGEKEEMWLHCTPAGFLALSTAGPDSQPDQKVCPPMKDLPFQGRPVTESDLVPPSEPPPHPQVVDGGAAYRVQRILDVR